MNLIDVLLSQKKTVLLDGAMGTQLAESGCQMGGQTNLTNPDKVLAIHQKYAASGVDIIITNTLTMNRLNIESHKIGVDVREVNLKAVGLARQAAGGKQHVLGDIGSTGKMLKPYGRLPEDDAYAAFKEHASILAEGGVDGFIIETMFDLREALCALKACKETAPLPVIVSMSFNTALRGGRTIMGNSAQDCAKSLTEAGADVVGTNCGEIGPLQMAELISKMREVTSLPLIAQPNAGKPKMSDGHTIFDMSPSEFTQGIKQCLIAGAQFVGGCCGTSPDHIAAVAGLLETYRIHEIRCHKSYSH